MIPLLLITSALAITSVRAQPTSTATPAATSKPCADPNYPSCVPEALAEPNYWGEMFKIPSPPVNAEWVKWVRERENMVYPIEVRPVSPNGTYWEVGKETSNTRGLGWLDPENAATELCGCTEGKWAFTFDDGPKDLTPDFLNVLAKHNVKATFFVVGSNVVSSSQYRRNLRAAYEAGHQIALHSWTHSHSTSLSTETLISEIVLSAKAVFEVIGKVPRYYRNPYGDIDDRTRNLMVAIGMRTALWNVDSFDTGAFYSVEEAIKTAPDGSQYFDHTLWTPVGVADRMRNVTRLGYQPGLTADEPPFTWVPQAPAAVRAGATPSGPYVGFISLHHELLKTQLDAVDAIIPLILEGKEPNFNLPIIPVALPVPMTLPTTTVSAATPTATTAAATVTFATPAKRFVAVTVAECDGDERRGYYDESEPFAQLIESIKLPAFPAPPPAKAAAAVGMRCGGLAAGVAAVIAGWLLA
ncbi:chitin deacetylase [Dinochytrium kinnereticum]|nr:chitin deacetylase [Dinochytrium kinnereticum]